MVQKKKKKKSRSNVQNQKIKTHQKALYLFRNDKWNKLLSVITNDKKIKMTTQVIGWHSSKLTLVISIKDASTQTVA